MKYKYSIIWSCKSVGVVCDKYDMSLQLLPEYQVSHERAVYKTVAIVANTKKIVQNMDLNALAELRAMFKPIIEIEELMTPIIVIRECSIFYLRLAARKLLICPIYSKHAHVHKYTYSCLHAYIHAQESIHHAYLHPCTRTNAIMLWRNYN